MPRVIDRVVCLDHRDSPLIDAPTGRSVTQQVPELGQSNDDVLRRFTAHPADLRLLGMYPSQPSAEVRTDHGGGYGGPDRSQPRLIKVHLLSIHYSTDSDELSDLLALVQPEEPLKERPELAEHPLLLLAVATFG